MSTKIIQSVCRICHGGCGALITVKDGRVVKVTGAPDSPMSKGWMCIKGMSTPEIANHPDRLTQPQRRKKGGGWEVLSWDDALDEISERIEAIRRKTGPESIALGQGTGRHHYLHTVRFANALGTPNWYEPGLAQCFIPRISVSNLTYGGFVVGDYHGKVKPKCILFWGHNPLVSSADGELAIAAKRCLEQGTIGIAVDPRRSETAQRCQLWLPVRPGTDAALALAMIHVIIRDNLYDQAFVEQWTTGFSELTAAVEGCTPEWGEQITGVPISQICEAARLYATTKPAILDWGLGIEQNTNCLQTVRAIACLRALSGNIDVPGGDILGMNILNAYPTLAHTLPKGIRAKRLGADTYKLLGGWRAFMPSAHIPTLLKAMLDDEPYPVRGMLVFGGNPLMTLANSRQVHDALHSLDLLVVADLFMTPTAAMADYVLPAAFWPEVEQVIGYPLVAENMVFAQQKATQHGECRQDEWIMNEISKRLNLPGSEESLADVINQRLASLGMTYEQLQEQGVVYPEHVYYKYQEKGFRTRSKKIELSSSALARLGYDPLPSYQEPPESPVSCPDLLASFPYILITGARRREFFHSEQRQVASLRRLRPEPQAELHPDQAREHDIQSGDWILVRSPRGSIRMKALVTDKIRSGTVSVDHGWWFPEKEGPAFGFLEANANVLTNNGPPYDPAFGTYQLRGLLCTIQKEKRKERKSDEDQ
ncbi:MAG: molybdopterin oxidoreductase [Candidatus Electrothrix sp. GM3_4]|nr:molybdopterin oxidoreductase [Candidatus Electrothrix sp. GM3_4]